MSNRQERTMSNVFVIDHNKHPLNPVHPGRARMLLSSGRAAVFKRFPFTIILKHVIEQPRIKPLRMKIDPGSKTTGIAIVDDATGKVAFAAEVQHRGQAVKANLETRRTIRRSRRQRKTRYRKPRFQNRCRSSGWLAPSLESRITNVLTWVNRFRKLCQITAISLELVKFDLQLMQNPEITGVQYHQGTLAGYEVRSYLLEKWGRACSYCGKQNVPLQIEHILSRAKGGTNRITNLTLACEACNLAKGIQDIEVFLAKKPEVLARILARAQTPLKDAAAVNTTRWKLLERLKTTGLLIECGSGGVTAYNRTIRGLPKEHWIDAAVIGTSTPEQVCIANVVPLHITAVGRQHRQMCLMNRYGFPRTKAKGSRMSHGFQTGDMVEAIVPTGKHAGHYQGKVAIKASGFFTVTTANGAIPGISYRYCRLLHRCDGYSYQEKGERDGGEGCLKGPGPHRAIL